MNFSKDELSDAALVRKLPGFTNGYAEVNGIRLHYVEGGTTEKLVMLDIPHPDDGWYKITMIPAPGRITEKIDEQHAYQGFGGHRDQPDRVAGPLWDRRGFVSGGRTDFSTKPKKAVPLPPDLNNNVLWQQ